MTKPMSIILIAVVALLVAWTVVSYVAEHSVKEPAYSVVEKKDGYEVRSYDSYILAQVEVSGSHEKALNEGFTVLADYIFGNNTKQASIAMTAPVSEAQSEKLAMTAPVIESEKLAMTAPVIEREKLAMTAPVLESAREATRVVSFVMPFEYSLETLPKPNNPRVYFVPQEARKVAALRFSWFRNEERVEKKKQELLSLLEKNGVTVTGTPEYAGYNAPFTAPWLMRNEVLVEIQ